MKTTPPVLTPSAVAVVAGKKTLKARRQLRAAESELKVANALLAEVAARANAPQVEDALERSVAAKAKVREAGEELGEVTELLNLETDGEAPAPSEPGPESIGRSGHGAQSVLAHLRKHRGKPR